MSEIDIECLGRRSHLLNAVLISLVAHPNTNGASDWCQRYRDGEAVESLLECAHPVLMSIESPDAETRRTIEDIEQEVG